MPTARNLLAAVLCLGALMLIPATALAAETAPVNDSAAEPGGVRDRPLPARWRGRHVNEPVFGSRMYVVEAGPADAPPVLLVHGLGQSGYQDWWEVIDELESDYRVIAFDLPGFGRSTVPDGVLSPARYSRLLAWLTQRLELEDVHLVGHSMGAAIALYHASEHPGRIANVVLADVAGVLHRVAFLREVASAQVGDYGLPRPLAGFVRKWLDRGGRLIERLVLSTDLDTVELLRQSDAAWDALLADRPNVNAAIALLETDYSRAIERFDHPVTILWGDRDSVAPLRTGFLLTGRLPGSELHVIEGAGHAPMRSHPDAFIARLRPALATPPDTAETARAAPATPPDYECRGHAGATISGHFDRIVLVDCPGMSLVNVTARQLRVDGSATVHLRHVEVDAGDEVGIEIVGSSVTATDLSVAGAPAILVDGGRLDMAGASVTAPSTGLRVARGATVIVSVSEMKTGLYAGYLHGAVRAADAVLDGAPALRSDSGAGRTVRRAPAPSADQAPASRALASRASARAIARGAPITSRSAPPEQAAMVRATGIGVSFTARVDSALIAPARVN